MERSERSSRGPGSVGTTPATSRAAPGRGLDRSAQLDATAPPPDDRDEADDELDPRDEEADPGDQPDAERAGPWEPDAALLQAMGLDPAETDAQVDPDQYAPGTTGLAVASDADAAPRKRASTCDGRPPWW